VAALTRSSAVLLGILALAAFLRVWGMDYGIPHPTARPDEERIVGRSMHILATGDFHPGDYTYPGLLKYLNTLLLAAYVWVGTLVGRYDRTFDFLFDAAVLRPGLGYAISRWTSVVLGVATVGATYLLGRDAYRNKAVGLVAAAALATNLFHVRDSRFATVDATMTFFIVMSILFAIRVSRDWRLRDFLLAGAFAGFATATKYNAGLVILSLIVPTLLGIVKSRSSGSEIPSPVSLLERLVLAGLVMTGVFVACTPYTLLNFSRVLHQLGTIQGQLYGSVAPRALWTHLSVSFPVGFGWLFFVAAAAGLVRMLWLRRSSDIVLLAYFVPSFVTIASVRWILPRYLMPDIPLVALAASEFLVVVVGRSRMMPTLLLGVGLAVPGLVRSVGFDRLAAAADTRLQASEWVAHNLAPQTEVLLCRGYGAPFLNEDRRRPPAFQPSLVDCTPEAVRGTGARFLITHEHPVITSYSEVSGEMKAFLAEHASPRIVFDPFRGTPSVLPYFYPSDAFFLPISHFGTLTRGGPIVTVWERSPAESP